MLGHLRQGRRLAALAIGATAAISLAACSGTSQSGNSAAPSTGASSSASTSAEALPAVATCTGNEDEKTTFKLGTFLPLTGSLAFLGPAAVAGSGQALSEIAAAGGVNGEAPCVLGVDSSDTDNPTIGLNNVKKLLAANVSAILGAESSSVTLNVLPTVEAQSTVMFSPANTADELSGASKWYFRDAPNNTVEGNALGQQIVTDGHSKTAILVFNDAYGTNLRDATQKAIEEAGGSVVYGAKGKGQEFPSTETNFSGIVSDALATNPDSLVIIAFAQTYQILPALASANFDFKNAYFVDGNLNDYSKDANGKDTSSQPDLTGAKGATQGANPSEDLKNLLTGWYKKNEPNAKPITAFGYGAESYDATMIMALAAQRGGSSDPATIQENILPVTGSENGKVCKTYKDCLDLLKGGTKNIWFQGYSGIGPLNEDHDPSTGYISIYQYEGKSPSKFLQAVKG
ncbi:ABC transporter substrate-binding protein [Amnibacterium endophyticum]|uniref:ABC transporter substrate-binding protein n=1 Tax=Amnibacterium endophyticum TaxID=2109337 RepID=A0ABW4LGG6_9MICO